MRNSYDQIDLMSFNDTRNSKSVIHVVANSKTSQPLVKFMVSNINSVAGILARFEMLSTDKEIAKAQPTLIP